VCGFYSNPPASLAASPPAPAPAPAPWKLVLEHGQCTSHIHSNVDCNQDRRVVNSLYQHYAIKLSYALLLNINNIGDTKDAQCLMFPIRQKTTTYSYSPKTSSHDNIVKSKCRYRFNSNKRSLSNIFTAVSVKSRAWGLSLACKLRAVCGGHSSMGQPSGQPSNAPPISGCCGNLDLSQPL
jgi:hypothetical protein